MSDKIITFPKKKPYIFPIGCRVIHEAYQLEAEEEF